LKLVELAPGIFHLQGGSNMGLVVRAGSNHHPCRPLLVGAGGKGDDRGEREQVAVAAGIVDA